MELAWLAQCTSYFAAIKGRKEGRHIRLRTCSIRDIGTAQIFHFLAAQDGNIDIDITAVPLA